MAKNYILKIEELEFNISGPLIMASDTIEVTDKPTDLTGTTLEIGGEKFLYAGAFPDTQLEYVFTRDGQQSGSETEEGAVMVLYDDTDDLYFDGVIINKYPDSGAPYTLPVYLYTGEDDDKSSSIGLPNKNVDYVLHAHNHLERIRYKLQKKAE